MSGKAPRQKGSRGERLIVSTLCAAGLDAYRIPHLGAMRGFKGDIEIRLNARALKIESKVRKSGFGFLYKSLGGNDMLAVRADRQETLVVMRLKDVAAMLGGKVAP